MTRRVPLLILGVSCMLSAGQAWGGVSFHGLGDLVGGDIDSRAWAVSADGTVVVGESKSASGTQAFMWTAGGGLVPLGYLGGGETLSSSARGVSTDGSVIVGWSSSASGEQAFSWTGSGMVGLGTLTGGGPLSHALSVSGDGQTIVGFSYSSDGSKPNEAWVLTGEGMVGLGDLPGGIFHSEAVRISADGTTIVGRSVSGTNDEAFRWTASGGLEGLGSIDEMGLAPSQVGSGAHGVSSDGSVIVGWSDTLFGPMAFRWTEDEGMKLLAIAPESYAWGCNADGSIVVGSRQSSSEGNEAFIWTLETESMRSLSDVLEDYEIDLGGWQLLSATAISADGRTIVGNGLNPDGNYEAWVITIVPEPATVILLAMGAVPVIGRLARRRRA